MSFSYTRKTGVYMSMYYSTKIFQIHARDYAEAHPVGDIREGQNKIWALKSAEAERREAPCGDV